MLLCTDSSNLMGLYMGGGGAYRWRVIIRDSQYLQGLCHFAGEIMPVQYIIDTNVFMCPLLKRYSHPLRLCNPHNLVIFVMKQIVSVAAQLEGGTFPSPS